MLNLLRRWKWRKNMLDNFRNPKFTVKNVVPFSADYVFTNDLEYWFSEEMSVVFVAGFNKALAFDFTSKILTTTPLDTWCCPGSTKCQGSPAVGKSKPHEPCRVQLFFGVSVKFVRFSLKVKIRNDMENIICISCKWGKHSKSKSRPWRDTLQHPLKEKKIFFGKIYDLRSFVLISNLS